MMDLLEARRQSHSIRNNVTYDIRFGDDGVVIEPENTFNYMMGGMTAPEQTGEDLFGFTGSDVVDTAKAAGRAVAGGIQDTALGVVGIADDIVNFLNTNIEPTLNFKRRPEGYVPPDGEVNMQELIDAGLQELGIKVPEGDSPIEAMGRSLVQFGAGMAIAPIRGVGFVTTMLRGGFADALFDPEEGNLSTLLKEFGLEGAILDYLDSSVDEEATAAERLTGRLTNTFEGALLGLPIEAIVQGFKAVRSDEGAVEIIRNKLTTVKERLTQPGEMPTVGSNLGNIADFKAPTEKEPGIIAFHGSGADFNKFRLDKINTGEGAQAFGYGLYFSDLEDVAKFYRNAIADRDAALGMIKMKYKGASFSDFEDSAAAEADPMLYRMVQVLGREIQRLSFSPVLRKPENAKKQLLASIDEQINQQRKAFEKENKSTQDLMEDVFVKAMIDERDALERIDPKDIEVEDTGKTYQVKLGVTSDKLLDYDKPLGEQNDFIKERLKKLVETELNENDAANLGYEGLEINEAKANMLNENRSVVSFLNDWAVFRGFEGTAEELLDKYGIKGIKYKADQGVGARNVPETGANNYVIFDDNLISIMKKYGIVGPVAVTAKSVASNNDEQEGI